MFFRYPSTFLALTTFSPDWILQGINENSFWFDNQGFLLLQKFMDNRFSPLFDFTFIMTQIDRVISSFNTIDLVVCMHHKLLCADFFLNINITKP